VLNDGIAKSIAEAVTMTTRQCRSCGQGALVYSEWCEDCLDELLQERHTLDKELTGAIHRIIENQKKDMED
jgi:hypothetical protein